MGCMCVLENTLFLILIAFLIFHYFLSSKVQLSFHTLSVLYIIFFHLDYYIVYSIN